MTTPTTATTRWFTPGEPPPDTRVRLFLLPHAGSGAAVYRRWGRLLPAGVGAQAVTLPGRQGRRAEPLPTDWVELVDELHLALLDELDDRPYALFGHCLGAQLAYRVAVELEAAGHPSPALVGVSGWAPRGFFRAPEDHHLIPREEMVDWIVRLGAVPAEIREDTDMLDIVLPPVIADFRVAAQYRDDQASVRCPLVSYGGRSDSLREDPAAMDSWRTRTSHYLGHSEYPGGHFYVNEQGPAVAADFVAELARITG
jgi:surfactin synthase thioesterase subunit